MLDVEDSCGGVLTGHEGVFDPHVSPEFGGHGLDMPARAPVFEEAGFSQLGRVLGS